VSGPCAAATVVLLAKQQQLGPQPRGAGTAAQAFGQQLVQKVTQVQSRAAPFVAHVEKFEALTVPSQSMPQLKCGVPLRGIMLWLPTIEPNSVACPPATCPSRQNSE